MIQKIRVQSKHPAHHTESIKHDFNKVLGNSPLTALQIAQVFRIDGISKEQAVLLAEKLFCEQLTHTYSLNKKMLTTANHVFEISYKPGVMNPEIASIFKAAKDLDMSPTYVSSSKEYGFFGETSREDLEQIILRLKLLNPVIEYIRPSDELVTTIPIQIMTDGELLLLSKDKLFLNLHEMKVIQNYFKKIKRNPTDAELETLAQTWSEHCAHKVFKASITVNGKKKKPLIERLMEEAWKHKKNIVSAFVDNSGVISFFDDLCICGKVETHNSPSAIEPYGGAMTGSGGVFRDILGTGLGAKNIVSTDMFCFAPADMDPKLLPPGTLPPEYLLKRVVSGVRDYGNRMGIPTNNGSVHFHKDFRAKPTVIVGAYGIIPKKFAKKGKAQVSDLIVAVGGKTGRDGIHGATFSSGEMTDRTIQVNGPAVQIGNAIEEKRMFDAILESRDQKCIRAMQDCGAGGFSSAIGEMGEITGVTVHLEKAPLKYEGLLPWEIWLSESQERMVLAVPEAKIKKFQKICRKYNVESSILGHFDGSKKLQLLYEDEQVCSLDMSFLHNGLPQRNMVAIQPDQQKPSYVEPRIPKTEKEWINVFSQILSHGNICSKEPIVRLYDHTVQGTNMIPPFSGVSMDGPNDAAVIRPILSKPHGMIVAHGMNPILNRIDPYWGSIWASVEALANYAAVGGDYKQSALINNYIWPFPQEEELWSLDQSVDAVCDIMKLFKLPVISGKDSLSSTYRGKDGEVIKIPPVLCMSVFGKIPDVSKIQTQDFKKHNSTICLVGKPDTTAMGGSTYYDIYDILGDTVPKPKLEKLPKVFTKIQQGIASGNILAAHDISEGGMLTTLFDMCVGGEVGASITIDPFGKERTDYVLFNETPGCFIVEVKDETVAKKVFKGVYYKIIGKTKKEKTISVTQKKKMLFSTQLEILKTAWQEPMKKSFQ